MALQHEPNRFDTATLAYAPTEATGKGQYIDTFANIGLEYGKGWGVYAIAVLCRTLQKPLAEC